MRLHNALSVLSKSSPFAVSTKGEGDTSLREFKEYLYVTSEIEEDFCGFLQEITTQSSGIIFLCGSSGDGKSEILTRYEAQYSQYVDFHLDGTHSYAPDETAIQTLDTCFSDYKTSNHPLVVGINIGMLGNYAEEGSEEHADIRGSICKFLCGAPIYEISREHCFLYFEDYSKFSFDSGIADSEFARNVMEKLTTERADNPFYSLYQQELTEYGATPLVSNYAMLSKREVQDVIVEVLLKARLAKDQFLTARTLLDFIYQILCSGGYIFDALFNGGDNELLDKIKAFDPVVARSRKLDQFIVQAEMGIAGADFDAFKKAVHALNITKVDDAYSYVRLFYLLKKLDVGNDFHKTFFDVLKEEVVSNYIELWNLHRAFFREEVSKGKLLPFYKKTLIAGIHNYINRKTPGLGTKEFVVSQLNGFIVAAELDVKPDFTRLAEDSVPKRTSFNAYLTVNDESLKPIPVSLNLLELLFKVQRGYQPSKHDSASILLLDEIADQIVSAARVQDRLVFVGDNARHVLTNVDDEYIEVEGV